MSPETYDDLETRLTELFDGQARALDVQPRAWDDAPMATVTDLAERIFHLRGAFQPDPDSADHRAEAHDVGTGAGHTPRAVAHAP